MKIERIIQKNIEDKLFKGKAIVIYGARQVGKTTLIKEIMSQFTDGEAMYLNCDAPQERALLEGNSASELKDVLGTHKILFIDEAQRVENIGLTIKLFVDTYPEIQIIATGSSSFDLANSIKEPLTGRVHEFHLYPISINELSQVYPEPSMALATFLNERLVYGMYPEVVTHKEEKVEALKRISSGYLYKDILAFADIRHHDMLDKLLRLLALQIGQEVSYNELAGTLGIDKDTVAHYVRLLEQSFIIFRLPPYYTNKRTELKKLRKIYFYDNGIRNALIQNFNQLDLRNDVGALWENFLISERMKSNHYQDPLGFAPRAYFWRTYAQQEIDYVEESGDTLNAFEFKWGNKHSKKQAPKPWRDSYPHAEYKVVDKSNFREFIVSNA